MFSSLMTCRTCYAYCGSPSSMAKAKELGRLHAKMSWPEGSLLGIVKPAGMEGTISIFERARASVL